MDEGVQPTRVIIRVMTEFMLDAVKANAAPHDGDLLQTVLFSTVRSAGLNHLAHGAEARHIFETLDQLTNDNLRPVSINAVAQSFALPYETARGAVSRLAQGGYCLKVTGGIITPVEALVRPEIIRAEHAVTALLGEAIGRLGALGLAFDQIAQMGGMEASLAASSAPGPPPARQLSWIATDFLIRTVESLVLILGDFTASLVFAGVMAANAKTITDDPHLAWAYPGAATPPPDALRRPVSVRGLAETIGMPFETVRRHVNRLTGQGDLARLDDGVMVPVAVMQSERFLKNGAVAILRFARLIADLKRAGYVFPDPAVG